MKRKMKKRFFIALVLCFSLFNFYHFYPDKSINNENINISTVAYASGESGVGDDEWIIDPQISMYSCIGWLEIKISNLFTTDEKTTSITKKK